MAVEKGYEIVDIEQVWHWPEDQRSSTLFKEYVATAYREKVEASGKRERERERLKFYKFTI